MENVKKLADKAFDDYLAESREARVNNARSLLASLKDFEALLVADYYNKSFFNGEFVGPFMAPKVQSLVMKFAVE